MKLLPWLTLVSCVLLGLASCNKFKKSRSIELTYELSGNVITLKWTAVDESTLSGYYITRKDSFSVVKPFTTDANTTTLVDTLPFSPVVSYSLVATVGSAKGNEFVSNVVKITRPDIALADIAVGDAFYDKSEQEIYVFSMGGEVQVYNVQLNKWVRNASWGSGIGYCDIGMNNGTKELYVPREDGWLFIYDAATLNKIDQIHVGTQLHSVNYNDGILYVCGTLGNMFSFDYSLLSYNRQHKTKIAQLDMTDKNRLKLVPGTNSEFYAMNYEHYLRYFSFDGNGKAVAQHYGTISGTYPVPSVFEVFPDGSKCISSEVGYIYNKDLEYQTLLPHGADAYTSFCFDEANQLIYAGCKAKKIQAYDMSNWQAAKTIKTAGVPFKVFFDNGSVICVSTAPIVNGGYYGALSRTVYIERFN